MRLFAALSALLLALPAAANAPLAQLQTAAAAAGTDVDVIIRLPGGRPARPANRRHPGGDDGRELAASACASAAFDSDRQKCMRTVSAAYYFDGNAVNVCRKVSFSSEVPECIDAIADKTYLRAESENCARESFGSGIIRCFRESGRSTERGRGDDAYMRRQLRRVRALMRDGRYREAERELDELIGSLEDDRP